MRIKIILIFALLFGGYTCCHSQVLITEELKNKMCYDAFKTDISIQLENPDGSVDSLILFPDEMITLRSMLTHKLWRTAAPFATSKIDIILIDAISDWPYQIYLFIDDKMFYINLQVTYVKMVKKVVKILSKYEVERKMYPVIFEKLATVYWHNLYREI